MGMGARVIFAIALFAAMGVAWLAFQDLSFERDRTLPEWKSLSEAENLLRQKPIPGAWAAGLFISERGLNTALESLKDAQIAYDPELKADEDTVVHLRNVSVDFQPGFAWAFLRLDAYSKKRNLTVKYDGQASLVFKGIEEGANGEAQAVFALSLLRLDPDFGWGWFNITSRNYASDLIETGLMPKFVEAFTMDLPFKNSFAYDLKQDFTYTVPVRDPKDENWIKVQIAIPPNDLSQKIHAANAVVLNGGIWLLTDLNEKPVASSIIGEPPPEIQDDIVRLRKNLERIRTPKLNDADIAFWINGTVARLIQDKFNQLPAANRTATVKSEQFNGRLADHEWRNEVLGEGEVFAELADPGAVAATIVTKAVGISWTKGRRLKVSLDAKVEAKASLDLHVRPITGRGVHTTVDLIGNTAIEPGFDARFEIGEVGDNTIVMLKPDIGCRNIKLALKTIGKAEFEEAWVRVPPVGADITLPLGPQIVSNMLLMSDLPFRRQGRGADGSPLKVIAGDDHFLFTPAWTEAQYAFVPRRVEGDDGGLWIAANLSTRLLGSESAGYDRAAAESKLAAAAVKGQVRTNCPGEPGLALTIGDLEFGGNEELAMFFEERGLPLPQVLGGLPGISGTGPTIPSPISPIPGFNVPIPSPLSSTNAPTIKTIPSPIPPIPTPAMPKIPSPLPPTSDPTMPKIPSPLPQTPGPMGIP
ncbi:hypothetical protein [Phyllobacterium endophyticum]|uniref:hypothetical protein n=1 Tax=Phyllobacterium endophyticum TaxID=1149773 RepID=UPI0011C8D2B0|nr:hypothetical protein [Phyllobacterium endophyticum]TXR50748.1 hypothetical protein FVA77_02690 [Phyllobacterium endophyticum]